MRLKALATALALGSLAAHAVAYGYDGRVTIWSSNAAWTLAAAVAVIGTGHAFRTTSDWSRRGWFHLLLASTAWLMGQVIWDVITLGGLTAGDMTPADPFWLAFPVLAGVGLWRLAAGPSAMQRIALLEAVPLAIGTAVAAIALLQPTIAESELSRLAAATATAYPILYVTTAMVMAQALVAGGTAAWHRPALVVIFAGIVLEAFGFSLWSPDLLGNDYLQGHEGFDMLWTLGLLAIGAGGLLAETAPLPSVEQSGRGRMILPAATFFTIIALLMTAAVGRAPLTVRLMLDSALVAVGGTLLIRGWILSREQNDLLERERRARLDYAESEARFRTLVANVPGAVYRCAADEKWTMAFLSDGIEDLSGYPAADFVDNSKRSYASIIHPGDREAVTAAVDKAVAEGEPFAIEYRIVRADGSVGVVYEKGRGVPGSDGSPLWLDGAIVDVSEAKTLEEQLRQSQKLEAIGRLAGGIAHDFNNMLTAVSGYAEFLQAHPGADETVRRNVAGIRVAADRAAALTRQLLAFTRQQVLEPHVLDLNVVVGEARRLVERLIPEDIEIKLSLGDGLGHVRADRTQLEQALVNLAVNARDAMPGGGTLTVATRNVRLETERVDQGVHMPTGCYVKLTVEDDGAGMNADVAAQAFDPFFTTKAPGEGSGLGLSTVYGIVKQSGGFVFIDSEPGRGTRVRIYFATVDEPISLEAPPAPSRNGTNGSGTILLVEDETLVRNVLVAGLEDTGYTTLTASSGREALALAAGLEGRLDVVVTDVVMPGMTGVELAEALRETHPEARVVFMSGYTDAIVLDHELGPDALFLQKPFSIGTLIDRLEGLTADPAEPAAAL